MKAPTVSGLSGCHPAPLPPATPRRPRAPPAVAFTPAALAAGVLPGVLGGLLSTVVAYPLELAETHLAAAGKGTAAADAAGASSRAASPPRPATPPRRGGAAVIRAPPPYTAPPATVALALSLAPDRPVGSWLLDLLASGVHSSVAVGAAGSKRAPRPPPRQANPLAPTTEMLGRLASPSPAGLYTGLPLSLAAAAAGWTAYFATLTVLLGGDGAPAAAAAAATTTAAATAADGATMTTAATAAAAANAPFIRVRTIAVTRGLPPAAAAVVAMDGAGVGGLWSGMGLHVAAMAPVVVQGALFEAVGGGAGGVAAAAAWGAATAGVAAVACYPLVGLRTRVMAGQEGGAGREAGGGLGWDDGLTPFVVRSVVPTAVLFGVRCALGG